MGAAVAGWRQRRAQFSQLWDLPALPNYSKGKDGTQVPWNNQSVWLYFSIVQLESREQIWERKEMEYFEF